MEDFQNNPDIFKKTLGDFLLTKGQILRYPIIGGMELNFYYLYKFVTKRGGFNAVCNKKQWKEIIVELSIPSSCTSASFNLRNHYHKNLFEFEQRYFHQRKLSNVKSLFHNYFKNIQILQIYNRIFIYKMQILHIKVTHYLFLIHQKDLSLFYFSQLQIDYDEDEEEIQKKVKEDKEEKEIVPQEQKFILYNYEITNDQDRIIKAFQNNNQQDVIYEYLDNICIKQFIFKSRNDIKL